MGYFIALIISALVGIGGAINQPKLTSTSDQTINNSINATLPAVCLDRSIAKSGLDPGLTRVPKILKNIKKPTRENVTRGYEIPLCQNVGNCPGPETADYILVATNIKADHVVFPNNFEDNLDISDRQLVKQTDSGGDLVINDKYRNRLYRTYCGDWCSTCNPADVVCEDSECLKGECKTDKPPVTLPYRGTYHCDFIFYLQDSDDKGTVQLDENGNLPPERQNESLPELPANKSFFSIYFRKGATIPDSLICPYKKSSDAQNANPQSKLSAQGLSGDIIQYPPSSQNYWKLEVNPVEKDGSYIARNSQIINYAKLGDLENPAGLTGQYEVYKNLLDPESDDLIYLVQPNTIPDILQSLQQNPPQLMSFSYFILRSIELKSAAQKSLKLGTFIPSSDWIKKWAQESKPAIYLYPREKTKVTIKLHPSGYLTVSDPPYDSEKGWQVIAYPDGTILLPTTNDQRPTTFPYLYYEAQVDRVPAVSSGFVVKKENLIPFLNVKLAFLGLNGKETKDYLEYWLPRLEKRPENYFLIYFMNKPQIDTLEPLDINMRIDSEIRIRTYFKPLINPIGIKEQNLENPPVRNGNTLVEWGGILDTP